MDSWRSTKSKEIKNCEHIILDYNLQRLTGRSRGCSGCGHEGDIIRPHTLSTLGHCRYFHHVLSVRLESSEAMANCSASVHLMEPVVTREGNQ